MSYIVFDTETTGLSHNEDRIIEIGAVILDGYQPGRTFQRYIKPDRPINPGAQKVHGLSEEFLSNFPPWEEVMYDMLDFFEGHTLVAHNASFDVRFINSSLAREGKAHLKNPIIDTLALARKKFPWKSNKLDDLCKRFNIKNQNRRFHGALKDSLILAEVFRALETEGQSLPYEEKNAISTHNYPKEVLELVVDEHFAQKHKQMLQSLGQEEW